MKMTVGKTCVKDETTGEVIEAREDAFGEHVERILPGQLEMEGAMFHCKKIVKEDILESKTIKNEDWLEFDSDVSILC